MGSGTYGGGGGGGGGAYSSGHSGYSFSNGQASEKSVSRSKAEEEVKEILRALPRNYFDKQISSGLLASIYEQLFEFSVHVFQNKQWSSIADRYGVTGEAGCLKQWVDVVVAQFSELAANQKMRETAQGCLEDFVIAALGADPDIYFTGTGKQAIEKLDRRVFDRTSNNFLGLMLWRILERERESMPPETETQLREVTQKIADNVVSSFENKFYAKNQTTYRQLFRVIAENKDWFFQQIRK